MLKPYGERRDDGRVQLSFVLPIPASVNPKHAARNLLLKMGLLEPLISYCDLIGSDLYRIVAYAKTPCAVNVSEVTADPGESRSPAEIDALIEQRLKRRAIIIGATIGADAHSVGLDAILNAKGYAGSPGLESYKGFVVHNLGSQIECEELLRRATELKADAILISQVVTHNDSHRRTLREFKLQMSNWPSSTPSVVIIGGPRISEELATEMGFDAAFGAGTTPAEVATAIATLVLRQTGLNR